MTSTERRCVIYQFMQVTVITFMIGNLTSNYQYENVLLFCMKKSAIMKIKAIQLAAL